MELFGVSAVDAAQEVAPGGAVFLVDLADAVEDPGGGGLGVVGGGWGFGVDAEGWGPGWFGSAGWRGGSEAASDLVSEGGELLVEGFDGLEVFVEGGFVVVLDLAEGVDDVVLEFGLAAEDFALGGLEDAHHPGEDLGLGLGGDESGGQGRGFEVGEDLGGGGFEGCGNLGCRGCLVRRGGLGWFWGRGVWGGDAAFEAGGADGEDIAVVEGLGVSEGSAVDPGGTAEEVHDVGGEGASDEDALDASGGGFIDLDPAGGGASEEDELGVKGEGGLGALAGVEGDVGEARVGGFGEGVVEAGVGQGFGILDLDVEDVDFSAGDFEGVSGLEPAGGSALGSDPGAGSAGEVHGEEASGGEVEVNVAGAEGSVVDLDVGAWESSDEGVGAADFGDFLPVGADSVDAEDEASGGPEGDGRGTGSGWERRGCHGGAGEGSGDSGGSGVWDVDAWYLLA